MAASDARGRDPIRRRGELTPILCFALAGSAGIEITMAAGPTIVLNEVHYHPASGSSGTEFVELLNHGADPVDLDGWVLTGGVAFVFSGDVAISPGEFLLLTVDADELTGRYGLDPRLVAGEYDGRLSNGGEELRLIDRNGYLVSLLEYSDDEPWPESADGLGPSLERISPLRDDLDPRAWSASIPVGGTPGERNSVAVDDPESADREIVELVPAGADWRFFRGVEQPPPDWTDVDFDDSAWELGASGFGYADGDDRTVLEDMRNSYLTVFIRKSFEVEDTRRMVEVELLVDYDDGFVAYLNGVEIARRNVAATGFDQPSTARHEAGAAELFSVNDGAGLLREGTNVLAVEGHNGDLDSSDFSLAPELRSTLEPEEAPAPPRRWERPSCDLVINELSLGGPGSGWVELYNPTAMFALTGGRSIRLDPPGRGSYPLPEGVFVAPASTLVVDERELGFELDGSTACLLTTDDGRVIDALIPGAEMAAHSTGRFPDGGDDVVVFAAPTSGEPNRMRLEVSVVINEIMYHPAAPATGEYVELLNRAGDVVSLAGWSLTGGIGYDFPGGAVLAPGGYLVVSGDPRAVESHHGLTGVLGPFDGKLNNDAESVLLRDELGNVVDRVRYADEGSWPDEPDGSGPSLELVHPELENRHGPAWAASEGDGTPGAINSRFMDDPPPIVVGVRHAPVVPTSTETVRVLATVSDERPLVEVTLFFEVDEAGGAPIAVAMTDDGSGDDGVAGNGVYGASITPRADLEIVAFWIRALARGGASVVVPAGAPRQAFLYQVEDAVAVSSRPRYRIVMRAGDLRTLRSRNVRSDDLLDLTFVAGDRAYYNRGIRYRGHSARTCDPLSYRIQFDHDLDFHGTKRLNLNGCDSHRQWIGLDFLRRTGFPAPRAWFRQLALNGRPERSWHLHVEAVDDAFLERALPGDADGNLYRGASQANLDYRGDQVGRYRANYEKSTNGREDDYSDVIDLSARFDDSTTDDAEFPLLIDEGIDTSQWASFFAAFAVLGSTENSILLDNGDDYYLYHRFSDDRWILLPWDLDSCFGDANQRLFRPTVTAIERFLQHPFYAPLYWSHLEGLLERAFDPELIDTRIDRLAPLFGRGEIQGLRAYAAERHDFISSRIHRELDIQTSRGGSLRDGVLFAEQDSVTLTGRAPGSGTSRVEIDGALADYDVRTATWRGVVDTSGRTLVEIAAIDRTGEVVARLDLQVAVQAAPGNAFLRCDANGDGKSGISDAIFSLLGLFAGGESPRCAAAADCNADGGTNLSDAVFNLSFLFAGGAWPAAPYPECDMAAVEDCAVATCLE